MPDTADLIIEWRTEGQIRWEDWWVRQHGHTRRDAPTFDDYLSFIDFDLSNNGLPRLTRLGEDIVIPRVPSQRIDVARQVVEYHGFRVARTI
jgi:hypothetical protein